MLIKKFQVNAKLILNIFKKKRTIKNMPKIDYIPEINTKNMEGCCLDCIIPRLLGAKYFDNYETAKLILNELYSIFTNKTHPNDDDIIDFKISDVDDKKLYEVTYKLNGIIQTTKITC